MLEMTTPTQDTRDRVIRMESQVGQLEKKIDDLDKKVTEMHQLLTQAKGARWMLMLMIGWRFCCCKSYASCSLCVGSIGRILGCEL